MGILDIFKKKQKVNDMEVNTKKCQFQGCSENVPQWAMYCQTHLEQIRRMSQQAPMPPSMPLSNISPPPKIPQQPQYPRQQQPIQVEQQEVSYTQPQYVPQQRPMQPQQIEEEQEEEEMPIEQPRPKRARPTKQRFALPPVEENLRLEIKKACMQSACGICISAEELMEQSYEQLILNIETLTAELYKIVISHNEEAQFQK